VTPLPLNMRQTVRDTDLLGYYLPAGTNVATWPGMNHWLPELWTEPKKFDPERFTEPRAEHKRHRYAFAPLVVGRTSALGWYSDSWRSIPSSTASCASTGLS